MNYLIYLFILLIIILLILVIVYTKDDEKKTVKNTKATKRNTPSTKRAEAPSFDSLYTTIKSKSTPANELEAAVEAVIKFYIHITPKLGARSHPDFDKYATIIMALCRHPNTNKNLILKFDKELQKANSEYAHEIEDFLAKGLSSRGL